MLSPPSSPANVQPLPFAPPVLMSLTPMWHGLSGQEIEVPAHDSAARELHAFIEYCRGQGTAMASDPADFQVRLRAVTRELMLRQEVPEALFFGALTLYRAGLYGKDARLDPQVQWQGENWAHYLARFARGFHGDRHILCANGMISLADRLEALADAGMPLGAWHHGRPSPVVLALLAGNLLSLEALLESRPPLFASPLGDHPLHIAVSAEVELLRALLWVVEEVDVPDRIGRTPLHIAAQCGRLESLSALLEAHANVEAIDANGLRPLHLAATHREGAALVRLLLARGARAFVRDDDGLAAIGYAARAGGAETVALLLAALEKLPQVERPRALEDLQRASDMAHRNGFADIGHKLARCYRQWVRRGSPQAPAAARTGNAAVDLCCVFLLDDPAGLKSLLAAGVNPDLPLAKGRPLLLIAVEQGRPEMVKMLLEAGADPKIGIPSNLSIWAVAAMQGRREVTEVLLASNLQATTAELDQAIDIARQLGSDDIAALLLQRIRPDSSPSSAASRSGVPTSSQRP